MKNADMPAMPTKAKLNKETFTVENYQIGNDNEYQFSGITKREQVLKDFMAAMLSNPDLDYVGYQTGQESLAEEAAKYVDAYFDVLEKLS